MNIKKTLSRRDFLKIVAISSAAGLAIKFGKESWTTTEMVSETRLLMGTVINITVVGQDSKSAAAAIKASLDSMTELEAVLSRFQPESQLSRLNLTGKLTNVHPALTALIRQSLEISQLSDGAFDITVKPLLDLYKATPGTLPTSRQIEQALKVVDYQMIDQTSEQIAFQRAGMSITLDGIAKGFIVDEGVAVLRHNGYGNVMVEAGGDLMGLGEKAAHSPWKIGLQDPRSKMGNLIASFNVQNQAVATSGDYMQAFTPDFANHHILDPRIGYSSPELASVSVIAPTAAMADGLATTVMVMGESGIHLIEQLSGCQAYAVTKNMEVLKTSGVGA